jgi:hypothetical protein
MDVQQHSFFEEYRDVCVAKPGEDKDWAVGTELRQCMLHQPDIIEPDDFREILVDDSLRRLYVLDANVLVSLCAETLNSKYVILFTYCCASTRTSYVKGFVIIFVFVTSKQTSNRLYHLFVQCSNMHFANSF